MLAMATFPSVISCGFMSHSPITRRIIESMHHKISFLRNPRYMLPPAVKQLQTQFNHGHRWNIPEVERPKPPIKANMTAKPDVTFIVEPDVIVFTDYGKARIGGVRGILAWTFTFPAPCPLVNK